MNHDAHGDVACPCWHEHEHALSVSAALEWSVNRAKRLWVLLQHRSLGWRLQELRGMPFEMDWAQPQSQMRRGRGELLDIVIVTRRERPCTRGEANNSALVVLGLDASTLYHNAAMLI